MNYYFDKDLNNRLYQMPKIFPTPDHINLAITTTGLGASKPFSALITLVIPNLHMHDTGQCFPLYAYEKQDGPKGFFDKAAAGGYEKTDNISEATLKVFQKQYNQVFTSEDIFFYIYGILHSSEYKSRFAADLKKMLPRIPFTKDFWAFSKAGRALAEWHLHYETVEPYPLEEVQTKLSLDPGADFIVRKMSFVKTGGKEDRTSIIYNSNLTLRGIPLEAYDYIVNGKSAIEWIMERYQWTQDKDSLIVNDPNKWSEDPRYIVDLVKRMVRVSLETMKIVHALPPLEELT